MKTIHLSKTGTLLLPQYSKDENVRIWFNPTYQTKISPLPSYRELKQLKSSLLAQETDAAIYRSDQITNSDPLQWRIM
mgnify:CR=1 FL=1|jgi:hypothetical protein